MSPIEWFGGYDLVLLGDIHLQYAKYNKKSNLYYGYPGSLVQQDFGEGIFHHGFLLWNLNSNGFESVEKHHVPNGFGRANLRIIDNKVCINLTGSGYEPLEDVLQNNVLPSELHTRLYCKEDTHVSNIRDNILTLTQQHNINLKLDIITTTMNDITNSNIDTELLNSSISSLTSSDTIVEFFKSNGNEDVLNENPDWESYVRNIDNVKLCDCDGVSEQIDNLVTNKNNKLDKKLEMIKSKATNHITQNNLRIVNIKFDWLLAFGRKNCFQFSNNKITLINAPNGYGKSAFFECIMLGLFGETIPSRYNKSNALSILNKRKPANVETSQVSVTFVLNGSDQYVLLRDFYEYTDSRNKSVKRLQSNKVELYENGNLIKTGARIVNTWITENVCSSQDFLLSTMITQNFDYDFFKLKACDQNELLDSVLNMKTVNNMSDVIKDAKKEYRDLKNHIDTFVSAKQPKYIYNKDEYNQLLMEQENLEQQLQETQHQYDSLNILPSKRFVDGLNKPDDSLEDVMKQENELIKELNILEVDEDEEVAMYDLHDLTPEQFVNFENGHIVNPCKKTVAKLVTNNKTKPFKDLVIQFREACDAYDYAHYNLENVKSAKPHQATEKTMEEYEAFENELKAYRKKYGKVKPMDEPEFDLDFEKPSCSDDLFEMEESELEELSKQTLKDYPTHYKHNTDCWACNHNFGSQQSNDAKAVIEYNYKMNIKNQWNKYLKKKPYVEYLKELEIQNEEWNSILPIIRDQEEWLTRYEESEGIMTSKLQMKLNIGVALQEVHAYQSKCNQAAGALKTLKEVKTKKAYYANEKLSSKLTIDRLNKRLLELRVRLGQLEMAQNEHVEYEKVKYKIEDITNTLSRKMNLFNHFVETFSKYKSWVYNEKVLPAIVNKTNSILRSLFQDRELVLNFMLQDSGIVFTVKDEGNVVNMEKLSGAQSFAVSLSFRLALSAVGITRFRCNQLFIDEGFCSFDQHNLLNVPVLIKNLKQLYDEIILVTHLEEIKTCADSVVNIQRNEGVSLIVN